MEALNTDLTGEAFLRQMTRTLAALLGVECAFVAVAAPGPARRLDTRALFVDGEFVTDFSYDPAGTPCDKVVSNQPCIYAERVQALFPGDAMLAAMGIESYAAVPLGSTAVEGFPLGVLGIMSRQALRRVDAVRSLLPMLASRAGAELVREREAKKFRDLFDSSPGAIFLIDRQSSVRMSSRAGERLFGWAPQALIGQQVGLLFPSEHRAAYEALFRRFVMADIVVGVNDGGSKDMWGRRRDGSAFPAQVQMRVLETAEGRMTVAHVQDITVRKQAESALRQLNEELESKVDLRTVELVRARDEAEQANRAKSAFLAAMSHEIRTPMNGVVGMIDVLEQSALKGEQVAIVKTVRESAHALLAIVDDVLDFSKIEAGQFEVDHEPMDAAAVVEAVCDGLDHLAAGKGVELTLFTDPAIPAQVLGDAPRLRQVLLNLTGNAIKFSSALGRAGRVAVRAGMVAGGARQAMLEFSVTDNGIGMDQATQARLFTPFTQADTSTTRRYGGTGLGLSISHGLVELMGGEIAARSAAGAGSTFTVRLPLAPLPAAAQGDTGGDAGLDVDAGGDAVAVDLGGLCCLVLGGPESPADDLAAYLAHAGALVRRAADPAAARQWLRDDRFADCPPGVCIGVIAGAGEARDETVAGLRAVCAARPGVEARFVVIERGRRRGPRIMAADLVGLDRDVLRRGVFLQAVARAATRIADADPAAPPADEDTMPAPLSIQEAGAQGRLILVAEDNEINRKVIQSQLALLGFTAHLTRDGCEALACARRHDYPLLLTDLHMPEMDGYALAAAIRAAEAAAAAPASAATAPAQRRMPIVALTANALQGEARRCRDLGMDDYMTKPVQLATLKAMLDKWLPAGARPTDLPASFTNFPASSTDLPPPSAAAPTAALDVRVLKALVGDEPAVIAEFLHDFRASAGAASAQLRAACQARQAAAVEALAHRLKSSARSVGALALGELCAQLEQAGGAGQIETMTTLWPGFETEMAAVNQALEAW